MSPSYRNVIAHYEPLTKAMRDQIVYLSHDLSDESAVSLENDAVELHAQVDAMFRLIDDTRRVASEYMSSVKP